MYSRWIRRCECESGGEQGGIERLARSDAGPDDADVVETGIGEHRADHRLRDAVVAVFIRRCAC